MLLRMTAGHVANLPKGSRLLPPGFFQGDERKEEILSTQSG